MIFARQDAHSFISDMVFRVARFPPRNLHRDVDDQLQALAELESSPEETISKKFLAEGQLTARCVGHGHGSTFCLRKQRSGYRGPALCWRVVQFLRQQQVLFAAPLRLARAVETEWEVLH